MDHDTNPPSGPDATSAPRARKRVSRRSTIIVIIAILLAGLFAWWLGKNAQTHASGAQRRRPSTTVALAAAKRGDIPVTMDALGTVTPLATATVRSLVTGDLERVNFVEGQMVRAGQLLVQIDPRPYQLALQQAQGQLLRDQAQLDNARLTLTRYRTLLAQDSIARQDVDTQAATAKQLQGTVATDIAAVGSAKLNLANCSITAPVSGRIGLRKVDVGNYVSSGDTTGVAVITVVSPMDIAFNLPETVVGQIAARQRTGQPIPVTALDRTRTTTLGQGLFLTMDNQIDVTTGTVKAKARFANADVALFPNEFVNVRILVSTLSNAIVLPAAAVRHGPNGDFVYVVDDAHTAHIRNVKVGPSSGESVSIASGINAGENVVTEGGDQLQDGGRVALPGDRPHTRPAKKPGLFGWLFGGGKSAAGGGQDTQASAPGGASAGSGGGGGRGGGRTAMMEQQLGLDAQQKVKADAIFAAARSKAMAQAGDDPSARRTAMRASMADAFKQLDPILRPDQKAKLAALRARMASGGGGGGGQGSGG